MPRQNMIFRFNLFYRARNNYCNFLLFTPLYIIILLFTFLITETKSSEEEKIQDYLLCRHCGSDIADLSYIINLKSPFSLGNENRSISGQYTLVQTLKNKLGIHFNVITVKKSACVGHGDWYQANTWFPGYAWKVCICQQCRHMLGWVFEPIATVEESQIKASNQGFYGLLLDKVLSEQFSNSLLAMPKLFHS